MPKSFIFKYFFNNLALTVFQHSQCFGHCPKHFTFNPENLNRETALSPFMDEEIEP